MKKVLITMLMAILAVAMLTACGSNKPAEEVDPVKEKPPVTTEVKDKPESDGAYEVGKDYILKDDMKVRKGPSTDSEWLKKSELAEEDKGKALDEENAILSKGTIVTCLESDGDWLRMSSGWICAYEKGRKYVVDAAIADKSEKWKDTFFEKTGVDRDASEKLSGTFKISSGDGEDSVEFFEDGECAVHFDQPMTPMTDEEGYTSGYYAVSGSKVYMYYGGQGPAVAFELSGKTLTKTSEQIEVYQG